MKPDPRQIFWYAMVLMFFAFMYIAGLALLDNALNQIEAKELHPLIIHNPEYVSIQTGQVAVVESGVTKEGE